MQSAAEGSRVSGARRGPRSYRLRRSVGLGALARTGALGLFGLGLTLPATARAEADSTLSANEAHARLNDIDGELGTMKSDLGEVAEGYRAPLQREGGRLQRRMREAEVQALLGDHYRAAIVLSDVAGRPEHQTDPSYPDAVFLLAESLRKAGYPKSARRYYAELARDARGDRLGQVVLGLLEVASVTGDFSDVERHVARLKNEVVVSEAPRVDFTFGKALFRGAASDVTRLSRALALFRSVPTGLTVSAPAAYYAGVTLVRMGRLEEAIRAFERAAELAPTHADSVRVLELASLSLGRLHQELGDTAKALDAYQGVSKDSPYFAEMLYEVAWVHVKAAEKAENAAAQRKSFQRALDAVELLMAAAPESRLSPDARVLQGNLQIRLGAPESAYDTFEAIVERYGGARADLDALLGSRQDARAFFDQLVAADLKRLDETSLLPPLVVQIALDDPQIAKAVEVRRALEAADEELAESRELVRTLETALRSEQRFSMFPGLRRARLRALVVQNRTLSASRGLLDVERKVVIPQLDPDTLVRLEAVRARAEDVERAIEQLPTSDQAVERGRADLRAEYEKVAHRAYQLLSRARAVRAQLVAAELFMHNQGLKLSKEDRALTDERMAQARTEVAALEEALEGIQDEIERADLLSRGDVGWARAERLRQELNAAIDEQANLLAPFRARLSGDLRGVATRIDGQREALRGVERELLGLQARLEQVVDARVDEVRQQVIDELRALEANRAEHLRLATAAERLFGPVAEQTAAAVGSEFRDLVMKADVGILDVAWARKRARTEKVTELVRELRQRSVELDEEFEEVLEDE